MADRTIVLATNGRNALRGLTQISPQEFSAVQEDSDELTYVIDMSSYLDGATISSVTRTSNGPVVSNTSNTTTTITQRLKLFGYVDLKVTTSSGDIEEFRITIKPRGNSAFFLTNTASVPQNTAQLWNTAQDVISANIDSGIAWIETRGYSTVGDSGGAVFKRVFSAPSHAAYITSNAGTAYWQLFEDTINPRAIGAQGDGSVNDTAFIQACIDLAESVGGGVVRVPYGTYSCTDLTIQGDNVSVVGVDGGYLFGTSTWSGTVIKARSGTTNLLTVAPVSSQTTPITNVSIKGVAFDGNDIASRCLLVQTAATCKFENIASRLGTVACIETSTVTGSASALNYVYQCAFENIFIKSAASGIGMLLAGEPAGSGGNRTVFCLFRQIHITHKNGTGLKLADTDDNSFINVGMSREASGAGYGLEIVGDDPDAQDINHANMFFFIWPGPGGVYSNGSKAKHNFLFGLGTEDGPIPVSVSGTAKIGYIRDDALSNVYWATVGASAVAINHTGTTSETVLATITIPASSIGANGRVKITTSWSYTSSGNNKTMRARFGLSGAGTGGTTYLQVQTATGTNFNDLRELCNRNSASSQVGKGTFSAFSTSTNSPTTSAIDTTQDTEIAITGQLASAGETLTLEYYQVEVLRGD